MDEEIRILKRENNDLKEKLNSYIPRRRVRRVYKQLKRILEEDIQSDTKLHIDRLKDFINEIEKNGTMVAGQDIKQSIEHLLSISEIGDKDV